MSVNVSLSNGGAAGCGSDVYISWSEKSSGVCDHWNDSGEYGLCEEGSVGVCGDGDGNSSASDGKSDTTPIRLWLQTQSYMYCHWR